MKAEEDLNNVHWINQFRKGDEHALKDVYELYAGSLFLYAKKILSDKEEEVKDILAESFVKLWERSAEFKGIQNIKAFLYVVTRNACLSYLRRLKKSDSSYKEYHYFTDEKEEPVLNQMIRKEFLALIDKEIETLPEIAKKVFKMIYYEGLSTEQISRQLNMPPQIVRNNKTRALSLLKIYIFKRETLVSIAVALLMVK
jgi:RNA polymerase sigma-70 factor (ECF subfamily)